MNVENVFGRFFRYEKRHGWTATLKRLALAARRGIHQNRYVLFYCDLKPDRRRPLPELPGAVIEQKNDLSELTDGEMKRLSETSSLKLTRRLFSERFSRHASLWLLKVDGVSAGYGWSISGGTMEPYFFQPGIHDAHLFDFFIFPEFRGQQLNPFLLRYILAQLADAHITRAYIEAAEWNTSQLRSLSRTPFTRSGLARKLSVFNQTIVFWNKQH
ncbi:MAG TPA: GNAT family N-acetyltransferase [Verrucomicrobiae bacterium]|nr:GNAT family N-acetyltransferase [Verrucomicrobiae bacterium]